MSESLISRSDDLQRLRDEGYELEIRGAYLVVGHVPYVNSERQVRHGMLVSDLTLAGDATAKPHDHIVMFVGDVPCDREGSPLVNIIADSNARDLGNALVAQHRFSSKPAGGYPDYFEKMTAYVDLLLVHAHAIDPSATPLTFAVRESTEDESVFRYADTATARAGIALTNEKLAGRRVAIVGLGGTGSYILDLIAKTPVAEIHLFDGDVLGQHNAFRSPGAPTIDDLRQRTLKSTYFAGIYTEMRRHIHAHGYVDESNLEDIAGMDFVFLAIDRGSARKVIVERLNSARVSFIDVGMGIDLVDDRLTGLLRVTASTDDSRAIVDGTLSFADDDGNAVYSSNIQIAELNALNAALAVIKWKKLAGFYVDLENEHTGVYQIDGNAIANESNT